MPKSQRHGHSKCILHQHSTQINIYHIFGASITSQSVGLPAYSPCQGLLIAWIYLWEECSLVRPEEQQETEIHIKYDEHCSQY